MYFCVLILLFVYVLYDDVKVVRLLWVIVCDVLFVFGVVVKIEKLCDGDEDVDGMESEMMSGMTTETLYRIKVMML